jgi:hypothetical protein
LFVILSNSFKNNESDRTTMIQGGKGKRKWVFWKDLDNFCRVLPTF